MALAQQFGLSRDPFARTVDPADAFQSGAYASARDAVLRDLAAGVRLIAVVGAAGTGKTLLLRAVEAALTGRGRRVRRLDRGDLHTGTPDGDTLLIDEADPMDDAAITALAQAAADPSHPAVVLALTRRRLDHLDLAVEPHTITLEELGSSDARDFVVDRVRRAGGDAALFTPGAIGALTYAAAGSPRLLRLLASGALFQATQDGAQRVEMGHARRAIAMQRGGAEPDPEPADEPPLPAAADDPAPPVAPPGPLIVSPRAERATAASDVVAIPADREPPDAPPVPIAADAPPTDEPTESAPRRRWPLAAAAVAAAGVAAAALLLARGPEYAGAPTATATPIAPAPAPAPAAAQPLPGPVAAPEPVPAARPATPAPEPLPAARPVALAEAEPETTPLPAALPEPEPVPAEVEPPRIVIRYAGGQPGAAEAAGRIADLMRARGHAIADVRAVTGRIREANVRYAPGERAAGETINTAFETVLRAYQPGAASRATPSAEGAAARGTVELWVPDSSAGAARPLRTDRPPG